MGAAAAAMTVADELFASRCEPPVLDVGCGPGRFVEWLAARGFATLGIDVRTSAVVETASRGGSVLQRDVEDRLPAEGRWGTVLLADGNIGLGGDPRRLLARCHELLRDGGVALVEVDGSPRAGVLCRRRRVRSGRGVAGRRQGLPRAAPAGLTFWPATGLRHGAQPNRISTRSPRGS